MRLEQYLDEKREQQSTHIVWRVLNYCITGFLLISLAGFFVLMLSGGVSG